MIVFAYGARTRRVSFPRELGLTPVIITNKQDKIRGAQCVIGRFVLTVFASDLILEGSGGFLGGGGEGKGHFLVL